MFLTLKIDNFPLFLLKSDLRISVVQKQRRTLSEIKTVGSLEITRIVSFIRKIFKIKSKRKYLGEHLKNLKNFILRNFGTRLYPKKKFKYIFP